MAQKYNTDDLAALNRAVSSARETISGVKSAIATVAEVAKESESTDLIKTVDNAQVGIDEELKSLAEALETVENYTATVKKVAEANGNM